MNPSIFPVSDTLNPPLYSGVAIRLFSFFFSPIAGGILAAQNLKDSGQPQAARKALWVSVGGMLLLIGLLSYLSGSGSSSSLGMGVGLGGGLGLELYAKKNIENWKEHPAKRIWKPLLICVAIFVPFIVLMVFALASPSAK
jgi:hypothetical protein